MLTLLILSISSYEELEEEEPTLPSEKPEDKQLLLSEELDNNELIFLKSETSELFQTK
ncbi:9729_t:CDS:1, partial [Scutellospora calospora]